MRGLFISFEGGEASGKTTQVALLENWLTERNMQFVSAREPGGTPLGEEVRDLLFRARRASARTIAASSPSLSSASSDSTSVTDSPVFSVQHRPDQTIAISPESEALLFNAARAQLVRDVLRPALDKGLVIVLDRYVDSTIAYQGYGRQGDVKLITAMCEFATGGLMPQRTFLLDVTPQVRRRRRAQTPQTDRFEQSDDGFHARVREGYRALAAADRTRFVMLDAGRPPETISEDVRLEVERLLPATTLTPP